MFWFSILLLRVSELAPRSNTCRAPSGEACNPHPDRAETLPPRRRPAVRAAVLASPALATGLPAAPGVWIALQACQSRLLEQVATWRVLPLCHRGRAASHSLAHTAPDRRFAARSRQQSSSLLLREAAARSCCGRARLVGLLCVGRGVVRTRAKSAAGSLAPAQRVPPSPPPPPPAACCLPPAASPPRATASPLQMCMYRNLVTTIFGLFADSFALHQHGQALQARCAGRRQRCWLFCSRVGGA